MDILLTDGSHMNTLAIMRRLKGHQIDILHHKKSAPAYSRYCRNLIISPNIHTEVEEYGDFLIDCVRRNKYDMLMPVGALASYVCSKNKKELLKHTSLEIADIDSFQIAIDKSMTFKFCEENNILYPRTYNNPGETEFPAIVKSTGEVAGKFPVRYVDNNEELEQALDEIWSVHPKDETIIQQRIVGEPYGFFCLYQNGILKAAIMQRRIREFPYTGGHATSAVTIFDADLFNIGKKIFDRLNWHGVGMAEFKKAADGKYYLIELNPKFWTALEMHIIAGINFPELLIRMTSENIDPVMQYKENKRFVWLFANRGELYRTWYRPQDIFKVLRDLFRSRTDAHIDDPVPTLIQFSYWIAWLFSRK